jgi:cytochrome P450
LNLFFIAYKLVNDEVKLVRLLSQEMLLGGAETSSLTIEWAMAEFIRNSMIMKHAQMELETVVGMNRIIEESDLQKLTYLQVVIKKTFCLHPLAPLLVPNSSTSKVCGIAKNYDIPPHTRVMVNVWAMGRDPSILEKPFEFYHERFLQQGQEHHHIAVEIIDMDENNFKLFPFESGR